ncbi:MAG TPA: class I SAM-dependent methyltransferase [Solirubrobacterales bacterium]
MTTRGLSEGSDLAKAAYDVFASSYDDFAYRYQYEQWTRRLLDKAEEAGLEGKRLLDVACGTGLSFLPMLERGFTVTACDISEAMLARARSKAGDRVKLAVADMRALPDFGEFDLVWALNDPLNYLLSRLALEEALAGFRRNLAPNGIALFDVNTPVTYRDFFSGETAIERNGKRMVWRGKSHPDTIRPRDFHEAEFEVVGQPDSVRIHRQRHHPEDEALAAIEAAGLNCVGVFGELGGVLYPGLDEETHGKAVYLCRR